MAEYFVATNGDSGNTGAIDSPWDIASALMGNGTIGAGDTLYIRGGKYRHPDRTDNSNGYPINLQGAQGNEITICPYAGERVTIDGGVQSDTVDFPSDLIIRELEFIVAENLTEPRISEQSVSQPTDLGRPRGGINIVDGSNIRIVNNIIHANGQGIGFWGRVSGDSEIHGNLIYDNGWTAPDRNHGHGLYTQNGEGHTDWKYITDNIFFDNWSLNLQAYGSSAAYVDYFVVDRNIAYNGNKTDLGNILVGGARPSQTIRMRDNVTYGSRFYAGYVDGGDDAVVTDNMIWAQYGIKQFTNLTASNNFHWTDGWANPRIDGQEESIPSAAHIALSTNAYDSNRANLVIMNFQQEETISADLSSFLSAGDVFYLLAPTDFYGTPVMSGIYAGGNVSVPMAGEDFRAFVIIKNSYLRHYVFSAGGQVILTTTR